MIQQVQKINRIEKTDLQVFKIFDDMQEELKEVEAKIAQHYNAYSLDGGDMLQAGCY